MQLLSQIKIQSRIIILVVIPLIATLLLAYEKLNSGFVEQEKIVKLDIVLDYAGVSSPYLNSILKEAFYTRLYIDSNPDKAEIYKRKMLDIRLKAQEAERAYITFIDDHAHDLSQFAVLEREIKGIRKLIGEFKYIRGAADSKTHRTFDYQQELGRELHTMYEMNFLGKRLLSSLSEIVSIASQNEKLGLMSNAYYNLLLANAETAVHNSFVFAAMNTTLDVYVFGLIYSSATKKATNLELFVNFSTDVGKDAYRKLTTDKNYLLGEEVAILARGDIYNQVNKPLDLGEIDFDKASTEIFKLYQDAMDTVLDELLMTKNDLVADAEQVVYETITLMVMLLAFISVISYLIGHSISNPLKHMVKTFAKIAKDKDMSIKLNNQGKDELSELATAFNSLLSSIHTTLNHVKDEAVIINCTTNDIVISMDDSLTLSHNQSQATDSISVAITEMTSTIEEVASMATHTSDAVQNANDISIRSTENATLSKAMMEKLTSELGNTSIVINSLNEETILIGNVLNVIQGIAEQTNLLALNAAIEAARAGEQGRGFAVVADEVRNLAGRTQESTELIRQQIETLQKGAEAATSNMENLQAEGQKAVEIVIEGVESVNVMKGELDNIMEMAVQIATAAEEQSHVSNEINERILAIKDDADKITNQTNQTSQSAQGLKTTGVRLNSYISEFQLDK
ncbi:methyl-accepting chemotaxis protein [Colwellia echini]|nr:methyl-accepting chemotaxis protein [Colwellia echini]